MFRRITLFSITVFLITAACILTEFATPHSDDKAAYAALLRSRVGRRPRKAVEQPPVNQARTGVQKDFWTQKHGHPSHFRLTSAHSDLWIQQRKKKFCITEQLNAVDCCIQEGTPDTAGELKWLRAKEGSFSYPANQFTAKDATLSIFSLHELELPTTFPTAPPHSSVSADAADWAWPQELHLTGNVRLFSTRSQEKQTFALADTLTYTPSTGTILLQGAIPKKVLLWQDDRQLSSPAIEITRDPKTKAEEIRGVGDVRLSFNAEEEATFRKIFGR